MKEFDVVVLGCGRAGAAVADTLAAARQRVAAVRISEMDDYADRVFLALEGLPPAQPAPIRFELLTGPARFLSPRRVQIGGEEIEANRFVLATGARPRVDPGLAGLPYLSALAALTAPVPGSAVIIGGGPVASVIADRWGGAGCRVTLLGRALRFLPTEDESAADALAARLRARGVDLHVGAVEISVRQEGGGFVAAWPSGSDLREVAADTVVLATGLEPNTEGLDLKAADVYRSAAGAVVVDEELRTSNPRVFAIGHVAFPGCSLAVQDHHAEVAAHNVRAPLFARRKLELSEPPFLIRTSPPLARVGLGEPEARRRHRDVVTASVPLPDSPADAAAGLIKLIGRRKGGKLLGAHLVGTGAAELSLFFDLLVRSEIPLSDVPDRRHFPLPGPTDAVYRALNAWVAAAYA